MLLWDYLVYAGGVQGNGTFMEYINRSAVALFLWRNAQRVAAISAFIVTYQHYIYLSHGSVITATYRFRILNLDCFLFFFYTVSPIICFFSEFHGKNPTFESRQLVVNLRIKRRSIPI